jgi:hypothetical protein
MLRHSNPATTQIYVKTELEQKRLDNSGEALLTSIFARVPPASGG